MAMTLGERDKKMNEMATKAAAAFCETHSNATDKEIASSPELYLGYSIPYLTVRALHRQEDVLNRQEELLNNLRADSRWIKLFAIITAVFTLVLLGLTVALALYARRLDGFEQSLERSKSSITSQVIHPQESSQAKRSDASLPSAVRGAGSKGGKDKKGDGGN